MPDIWIADDYLPKRYGLAIDIEAVIQQEGIQLRYWPFESRIIGALMEDQPGHWTIAVNTDMSHGRRRYTLAHEFAHYKLHRERVPETALWCYRSGGRHQGMEREANRAAARMLIPERLLRLITSQCTWTVAELAEAYEVSRQAMEIRLRELGILEGAVSRWTATSRTEATAAGALRYT